MGMRPVLRFRLLNAIGLGVMVFLGLGSKVYAGWGEAWVYGYSGDVVYEMFWIWLVGFAKPRWPSVAIATTIFLITSMIEFSQLIPFPEQWQANLLWKLLLGVQFVWWDFPHYALGCVLGALGLAYLKKITAMAPWTDKTLKAS
jgi:Protein of unknown function (DUF2809)